MILLYRLDRNSRESLTSLAKKLKTSKEVVHYRIHRLQKEGYLKKFYTIINMAKLGYEAYKVYFQFQNLTRQKEKEILDFLTAHERIFWVATCSGKWDLMIGTWARNTIDFNNWVLDDILNRYSNYILNKSITITKHNRQWNRRWFHESKDFPVTSTVGGEPAVLTLNAVDQEILRIIANNARLPLTEISRKARVSAAIIKYRLNHLLRDGVICSFRMTPHLPAFGYGFFKAFVYLQNNTSVRQEALIKYCQENKNILNVVTCVGSWDFEIEFEVESFERFNDIMKNIREKFPDLIKNYESVLISSEPRVDFMPGCYAQF